MQKTDIIGRWDNSLSLSGEYAGIWKEAAVPLEVLRECGSKLQERSASNMTWVRASYKSESHISYNKINEEGLELNCLSQE
jgi:hypothetical protein